MKSTFLSSTPPHGLYKFFIYASKINADLSLKKKLEFKVLKKKKKITFSFLYFFFSNILSLINFKFSWEKIVFLKYKNCQIGRFAIARTFREESSYKNDLNLYINLIKNIFICGTLIDTALKLKDEVAAVYIDHIGYLNGALFSIFSKNKIRIYTNAYPRGLFFIDFKKKKNKKLQTIENALKITKNKKKVIIPSKHQISFFRKILEKPNTIPYMKYTKFTNLKEYKDVDWKKYDYIIYAHSFLDAQLWLGYDGFKNLYDWLDFSIYNLLKQKKKIIIKSHPNFYNSAIGNMAKLDQDIFKEIYQKYHKSEYVFFINKPIKNFDLLKNVSKKTILISHHGSALIEGLYLGFKCISSKSTFWNDDFKLTNNWKNINEYKKVLNKKWSKLNYCANKDLNEILNHIYWKNTSIYGDKYILEIISSKSGLSREKMFKLQHNLNLNKIIENEIIKNVNINIEEIEIN